jgi:hypothetical protein
LDRTVGERVDQFAEFVELVDLLLRQQVTHYQRRFYRCDEAETIPSPVQRPRPPITIAAHGPLMLRIATRYADGWSCWGGYGVHTDEDFHTITADRSRRVDDLCADLGRDPATIRHQVVCFPPLTSWQSVPYFTDMVGRFRRIGIDEFVLYWPQAWRDRPSEQTVFDEVTHTDMPAMRATG